MTLTNSPVVEWLDFYTRPRPSLVTSVREQIRGLEGDLQRVADARNYLIEQMKKADAAEVALSEALADARAALAKLDADEMSVA